MEGSGHTPGLLAAGLQAAFGLSGPSPVPGLSPSSKTSPSPGVLLWALGDGWFPLTVGQWEAEPLGLLERGHWAPAQFGCKVNSAHVVCGWQIVVWGYRTSPRDWQGWDLPGWVLCSHSSCVPKHQWRFLLLLPSNAAHYCLYFPPVP